MKKVKQQLSCLWHYLVVAVLLRMTHRQTTTTYPSTTKSIRRKRKQVKVETRRKIITIKPIRQSATSDSD